MVEYKKHGFIELLRDSVKYISQLIASGIFPQISDGAGMVMKNIEDKVILIEKRVLRKIFSLSIIGFGGVLLVFALFFFMIEDLGWSKAVVFFAIGITVFVTGLIIKLGEFRE